uniref:CHK kinase-like domain-containing protein n=1 Tax=Panagrolaimus sp. PS1159 TaxID=55785 RepID=A0AC35GS50_9BILA
MGESDFNKEITKQLSTKDVFDICVKEGLIEKGKKQSKEPEVKKLGENKGLCSNVFNVKIFYDDDKVCSIVAKIPTTENFEPSKDLSKEELEKERNEKAEKIRQLHQNELEFYRLFKKHKDGSLKIPHFIDGSEMTDDKEGFILTEDFSSDDDKEQNDDEEHEGFEDLNDEQIKQAICEVTKLQALGYKFPEARNLGKLDVAMNDLTEIHHDVLDKFADLDLDFFDDRKLKLLKENAEMDIFEKNVCSNKAAGLPEVLSHNDFWTKNVMFSPKTGELQRIIDWQTVRFASLTHDLAALLSLELSGQHRREHEKSYVEYYLQQVKHYLDKYEVEDDHGLRKAKIEDVMKAYNISLKIAIFGLIFTLMESEKTKKSKEAAQNSELVNRIKYLFEDLYSDMDKK